MYSRTLSVICTVLILSKSSFTMDSSLTDEIRNLGEELDMLSNDITAEMEMSDVEELIEQVEQLSAQAEKSIKEGILPVEYTEELYSKMDEAVEELVDLTNESSKAYKFLSEKGIERIVLPNIAIPYAPLRKQLLLLIKGLFDITPVTTTAVIPIGVVDKVMDIFEKDDNLALKAHALDILYVWLPENPQVQTRVMKMKGLEPFYQQISKLDTSGIETLLDLFNIILDEHVKARNQDMQRTKADYDRMILYQRIGLIERMSTPIVCNGLINILETTWSYNIDGKTLSMPIFELLKSIKPYCVKIYKAKPKRTKLFDELLKFVSDPDRNSYFYKLGINLTESQQILKEYADIFKETYVKDEF